MAIEKILNTRIINKNDTLANLNASTFIPKKGEIILAEITVAQNNGQSVPTYLMKVGDGVSKFSELKFAGAQAMDVYAWAKQSSLPVEAQGTGNVVSGISWDATNNKITYTTASVATSEGLAQTQADVLALQNAINALDVADTAVDGQYVSAVSQTDGKITVSRKDLPTLSATVNDLDENGFSFVQNITASGHAITGSSRKLVGSNGVSIANLSGGITFSADNTIARVSALEELEGKVDDLVIIDDVAYDSANKKIYLKSGDDVIGDGFDASAFIKDGMLDDVSYDASTNTLTFTWNTDAGAKTDTVVLSDILDPYVAGTGITITGTTVALSAATQASLALADSAVQASGLATAKSEAIADAKSYTDEQIETLSSTVASSYKKVQTAVTDANATTNSSTAINAFVSSVTQDAQGKIIVQKAVAYTDAEHTKASQSYSGADAEVWVFDCGSATTNI